MPKDLVSGTKNARYSPGEVIEWLETMVRTSTARLQPHAPAPARARSRLSSARPKKTSSSSTALGSTTPISSARRSSIRFTSRLAIRSAAAQSLAAYRKARDAWANMAERADKIYTKDISYGDIPIRRGHWAGRLPEIDQDLAALENYFRRKAHSTVFGWKSNSAGHQGLSTPHGRCRSHRSRDVPSWQSISISRLPHPQSSPSRSSGTVT